MESFKGVSEELLSGSYAESPYYGSCIDDGELKRLASYLDGVDILSGGDIDWERRKMQPTLVTNIPKNHPLASEEIFGPILPVHTFDEVDSF